MRALIICALALVAPLSADALFVPHTDSKAIPNQYVIVFKPHVSRNQMMTHWTWLHADVLGTSPQFQIQGGTNEELRMGGTDSFGVKRVYDFHDFKGYAARLPAKAAEELQFHPDVEFIEEDMIVTITDTQKEPPSWGLDRISERELPLHDAYDYPKSAGEGVTAYIVDTGINIAHPEFEKRAKFGKSFVQDKDKSDGNGHGSHVAGTIGAKNYGIAKKVKLVAVKVLDAGGSGSISGVIGGIEFVATEGPKTPGKAVANLSLGGPASKALDAAVKGAIKAGVVFVVAAGNSAGDACKNSPAAVKEAITVAASDKNDRIASFSDLGTCVDIIAPGVDITSTWKGNGFNTISGTSMASPHVAGVVALALAEGNFTSPADVSKYLVSIASKDKITGNLRKTPNSFLYNNVTKGTRPDDEPLEPKPAPEVPEDPEDPGVECPFPQCLFDPSCTSCCVDCWFR